MTTKKITITTICISLTAICISMININSACIQEAKLIKRLENLYARSCAPDDKKCLKRAKKDAEAEKSFMCSISFL